MTVGFPPPGLNSPFIKIKQSFGPSQSLIYKPIPSQPIMIPKKSFCPSQPLKPTKLEPNIPKLEKSLFEFDISNYTKKTTELTMTSKDFTLEIKTCNEIYQNKKFSLLKEQVYLNQRS